MVVDEVEARSRFFQLRLSTLVVLMLVAGGMVQLNLHTPMPSADFSYEDQFGWPAGMYVYHQGWTSWRLVLVDLFSNLSVLSAAAIVNEWIERSPVKHRMLYRAGLFSVVGIELFLWWSDWRLFHSFAVFVGVFVGPLFAAVALIFRWVKQKTSFSHRTEVVIAVSAVAILIINSIVHEYHPTGEVRVTHWGRGFPFILYSDVGYGLYECRCLEPWYGKSASCWHAVGILLELVTALSSIALAGAWCEWLDRRSRSTVNIIDV